MPKTVEKDFELLTKAGYLSEDELKRKAYRALLREEPELKISLAVERYKREEVTLNRAAEIAGVTNEEMKEILDKRGIEIKRKFLSREERRKKAKKLAEGA